MYMVDITLGGGVTRVILLLLGALYAELYLVLFYLLFVWTIRLTHSLGVWFGRFWKMDVVLSLQWCQPSH